MTGRGDDRFVSRSSASPSPPPMFAQLLRAKEITRKKYCQAAKRATIKDTESEFGEKDVTCHGAWRTGGWSEGRKTSPKCCRKRMKRKRKRKTPTSIHSSMSFQ